MKAPDFWKLSHELFEALPRFVVRNKSTLLCVERVAKVCIKGFSAMPGSLGSGPPVAAKDLCRRAVLCS